MPNTRRQNLVKYLVPTILSNCSFALFSVVDGIFVGRGVGTDALGAVNLAMPFIMLVNALFMLTTMGGITIAAIRHGRGDDEGANQAFMHALISTVIISLILMIVGVFMTHSLVRIMGANETFYQLTYDYIFWYSLFILPSGISTLLQGFCRNDDAPGLVGIAVVAGTALNIFGDWLFVYPLQMGVKGAAIATGLSQILTLAIVATHFIKKRGKLRVVRSRLEGGLFAKILLRGLPAMIAQFSTPVTTLCMNLVLIARLGNDAVNAFSVIGYVASVSCAIFFGAADGLQPLFGLCYGAKDRENLSYYYRAGITVSLIGSVAVYLLLLVFGGPINALFDLTANTYQMALDALPKYGWSFIVLSVNTILSAYLYSTKRTREAVILNLARSVALNVLAILVLPVLFGNGIIWHAIGIGEALALLLGLALIRGADRREQLPVSKKLSLSTK